MMWDEDAEVFMPGAAHGLTPEQQADFEQWVIAPGEEPAFDQLRALKSPTLLPDWYFASPSTSGDSPVSTDHPTENIIDTEIQPRPLVLFPMTVHSEVLGGLLVDFCDAEIDSEEFLHDEKLAIIQGIAHQTAIAVENIRLLKAQKEEAYASVALLQVAQAVVSLTELNEILESIVRLAPILVGVSRCAVYLWDELRAAFWMAQSYGLPRSLEVELSTRLYQPGEFPILDAVYKCNTLVNYPLDASTISSAEWDHLIPPELDTPLNDEILPGESITSDQSYPSEAGGTTFSNELLKHEGRLLLAFPLAVKGNVLGAMLAEEAAPTSDESSYHIRERRLEILTGITQQASLAIQNDRLQSEVVERERLERELQLARQIQKRFLPQELPTLPGWDLAVRWRTARQVGGDFYDIFELPGKKLGLVIADVADKGMPAALFMILVRTLIRAAVHEEESPAEVLEEVNDLMIPDTQNGMFVTAIYAVLSIDTGHLIYANAGHNLPLLLRSGTQTVECLPKGGMALGIEEGIHLEEHNIFLEADDCVIFYTDGITEAFSTEGEMYGEERLRETIHSASCVSARIMLDAIDDSVNAFIGDDLPSDDLTMVAVRRIAPDQ
jgi:serine phosphatase RsbU (regulator of sigma subunit)